MTPRDFATSQKKLKRYAELTRIRSVRARG